MESIEFVLSSLPVTEKQHNFLLSCQNGLDLGIIESLKTFLTSDPDDFYAVAYIALSLFAQNGNLEAIKYMVDEADVDPTHDAMSLVYASQKNHLPVIQYLLEQGVDPTSNENLSLMFACAGGFMDIVYTLVEYGADVHAWYDTPLVLAAKNRHTNVFKFLYENYGADPYTQNNVILKTACINHDIRTFELFLELGLNINVGGAMLLAVAGVLGFLDLMKMLIDNGVDAKENEFISFKSIMEVDKTESFLYLLESLGNRITEDEMKSLLKYAESTNLPFKNECCKFLREKLNITFLSQFPLDIELTDECPVCLEKSSLILGCRHCICEACLQKLTSNECPVCRLHFDKFCIKRKI